MTSKDTVVALPFITRAKRHGPSSETFRPRAKLLKGRATPKFNPSIVYPDFDFIIYGMFQMSLVYSGVNFLPLIVNKKLNFHMF